MKVQNPATNEVINDLAEDSPAAVAAKVERARAALPAWLARPVEERIAIVRRFRDLLVANKDDLARTLTREMGKPIKQSRNELAAMPGRIDYFLEHVAKVLAPEPVLHEEKLDEIIGYEPLGVVANVSAWNYPYFVSSNVFVPALLCGNTVVFKPSEYASMSGLAMARLLHEAGVPEDAFIPVVGGGDVGSALVAQPVDGVFFTGSYATGRRIVEALAGRMIRVQLELGGKDPTYVCDDADPVAAAESLADGAMYNAGQSCCSVERIYVHAAIAPVFVAAFAKVVEGFVVGDPEKDETYVGPLARKAQIAVLEAQVEDALRKGGRLLVGGRRLDRPGNFFAPTVFADASHDMALMREESFGPIIGIQPVRDDEEAIRLMNDTEYGLTAGVYTPNRARAEAILRRVDAGSVYWNCCDRVSPRLPWTGRKHSGMGSTLSEIGIRAFLEPKAWHLRAV